MKDRLIVHEASENLYLRSISETEEILSRNDLDHRFVGGVLPDLLDEAAIVAAKIDPIKCTLYLPHHRAPNRKRDDGTIKDLDVITFSPSTAAHNKALAEIQDRKRQTDSKFPTVSIDRTKHKAGVSIKLIPDLVSALQVGSVNQLQLRFGKLIQTVDWRTVEPWRITLSDGTSFTALNPYAHALRYFMRSPGGVKRKDKENNIPAPTDGDIDRHVSKVHLLIGLVVRVKEEGEAHGIDYESDEWYRPWKEFVSGMLINQDLPTRIKGKIMKIYWDGPGTKLAHSQALSRVGNIITRNK